MKKTYNTPALYMVILTSDDIMNTSGNLNGTVLDANDFSQGDSVAFGYVPMS